MVARPDQRHNEGTDSAARDVLAAEAFPVSIADPTIHSRSVSLPDDPTGIEEPHDILAAEEFAMPALRTQARMSRQGGALTSRSWLIAAGLVLAALVLRRRYRIARRLSAANGAQSGQ
jgi:hypothetical protein